MYQKALNISKQSYIPPKKPTVLPQKPNKQSTREMGVQTVNLSNKEVQTDLSFELKSLYSLFLEIQKFLTVNDNKDLEINIKNFAEAINRALGLNLSTENVQDGLSK